MNQLKNILFTFILIGAFTLPSSGQRMITGRVLDKETGKPIKAGTVVITGTGKETALNALGFFQLQIDSIDHITINCSDYAVMEINVPNSSSFAIQLDRPTDFLDEFGFPCEKTEANAYRMIYQHPSEPNRILVKQYYLDNTLKEIGAYSDKEIYIRDGIFSTFYPNGQRREEGYYEGNSKVGMWTSWYENSKTRDEISYDTKRLSYNNTKGFTRLAKVENYWDSEGNQSVILGNGEYLEQTSEDAGQVDYAKGSLKDGFKIGTWTGYLKNGKVAYEEQYNSDGLINGRSYDSLGRSYSYDQIFPITALEVYSFIGSNLRYPSPARQHGIEGKVIIHMVVDANGRMLKSRVAKGIGGGCDEEALRVVNKYNGSWNTGLVRGQPTKTRKKHSLFLPIMFKLG